MLQTIVADEELGRLYRLHDVVTLVDAVHGEAQLDANPESLKQAAVADALLITKSDLAPRGPSSAARRLARLNPGADLHEVLRGAIDPDVFLRGQPYDPPRRRSVERWLGRRTRTRRGPSHDDITRTTASTRPSFYHDQPIRRAGS